MINLLVAKTLLYLCGVLSSLLVLLLCLEFSERSMMKYYYLFLIIGILGCFFTIAVLLFLIN